MKLHRPLLRAVETGLEKIFTGHQQSNDVVAALFQSHPEWGSRDRRFIAENIYEIVRYKRLYDYCGGIADSSSNYFNYLTGIRLSILNFGEADEFYPNLNSNIIHQNFDQAQNIFQVRESIPDWLDEFGRKELNEKWEIEIHALNEPARVCLRHNSIQCKKEELISWLDKEKISFREIKEAPDALVLDHGKNLKKSVPFKKGWFEIQDVSSQAVAPFLKAKQGMKILDACAGAGGKSLHLASLMKDTVEIFACDVDVGKLRELRRRAKRGNVQNIKTYLANDSFTDQNKTRFDRILLDVPCSGSGTLRRKPDLKWSLSKEKIEDVIQLQKNILVEYQPLLKANGLLLYSTCSIFQSENKNQVEWFLSENKNFRLLEEKTISPAESGFDGFYMALLEKASD